jgi:6-phosphogluconate dehydrogenase
VERRHDNKYPDANWIVGLGRMGANIARRLANDGHNCIVYDINPEAVRDLEGDNIKGASSLADLLSKLSRPRTIWLMLPAGITQDVVDNLATLLSIGDVLIDGGNTFYQDDIRRFGELGERGNPLH